MGITTETKRRSALLEGLPPVPDGTIATTDRQHIVWVYAGIAATTAAPGPYGYVAAQVYQPGQSAGQTYQPGHSAAQAYTPGAVVGEAQPT